MEKNYFFKTNVILSVLAVFLFIAQATAQFKSYTGAADPRGAQTQVQKPVQDFSYKYLPPTGREGGETIATAIPITSIPFTDVGFTCDNINDYDEACPYTGSTSPDVVYSYTPSQNVFLNIDICNSDYDTKLYVYANTVGNLIACNDDACGSDGWKSRLNGVAMTTGNIYYIIIDGYGGNCGNYNLVIDYVPDCSTCLPCSTPEGEPDIQNDGVDVIDGGCNMISFGLEPLFIPVQLNQVICGRSNFYNYFGTPYRDTDWYTITLTEAGTLYWSGFAEFDLQLIILNTNCPNLTTYAIGTSGNCGQITLHADLPAGTYYLWAGPTFSTGLPGGMNYNVIATLNAPPVAGFCTEAVPVSNWALFIGLGLILVFTVIRFRKMV